ncbi:MAG TPA: hypothetical protein V6C65_04890 [Allocoleopsis sp.]
MVIHNVNNDVNNSIRIPDEENYQKIYINPNCLSSNEYDEAAALIILAFITGATGSIVSILTRIEQYQNQDFEDTKLPFYIGLVKPIIGGTFGILLFVTLASGFIPISIQSRNIDAAGISIEKWLTVMTVAFVAGFSERFAKDIVGRAEQLGTGTHSNQQDDHAGKSSTH